MAYVLRLADPLTDVPEGYPPPDPEDPSAYPLRYVELDMLVAATVARGGIADRWEASAEATDDGLVPAAHLFEVGRRIGPAHCRSASRCMQDLVDHAVEPRLFEALRQRWNAYQAQAACASEIPVTGFEPFHYDPEGLRKVLVHWGFFLALATDRGGIWVRDPLEGGPNLGFVNQEANEVNVKITYAGAGDGPERTLLVVDKRTGPPRGELMSVPKHDGQIVFFNFTPTSLGTVDGLRFRFHLYAGTGDDDSSARAGALMGSSVVVFTLDARAAALETTQRSWQRLARGLAAHGFDPRRMPTVFQLVETTDPTALDWSTLRSRLMLPAGPHHTPDLQTGQGVFDSLKSAVKLAITQFREAQ